MANFTEGAKKILEARYLFKDKKGVIIETPGDMLIRVATAVSKAEKPRRQGFWQDKFYTIMYDLEFLPNSPTLMNAGKENGQLAGCFLIEIEDDMSAILEAVKRAALIHKTGGGCFADGTAVWTKSGLKNIKDCFINEPVLCYNINKEVFEWGNVIDTYKIDTSNKDKVEIEFEEGTKIICTEDHPFRVKINNKEEWVEARNLTSDMDIINYNESTKI